MVRQRGYFALMTMRYCIGLPLAATAFWIWMLVDCATYELSGEKNKLVWLLLIIFTHFIGALIYFFVKRQVSLQIQGY